MATTPDDTAPQLTTTDDDAAFAAAISGWSDSLRCEMTTAAGAQCRRAATWRLNLHGCELVLMCGQHLSSWRRDAEANTCAGTLLSRCVHCGRTFATLDSSYTVVGL